MGRGGLSRREDGALVVKAGRPGTLPAAFVGVGLAAFAIVAITRAGVGFWPILVLALGIFTAASPLLLALARPRLVIGDRGVEVWAESVGWHDVAEVVASTGPDPVLPYLRATTLQFRLTRPDRVVQVALGRARIDAVVEEIERRSGLRVRDGDLVDEALARAADRPDGR